MQPVGDATSRKIAWNRFLQEFRRTSEKMPILLVAKPRFRDSVGMPRWQFSVLNMAYAAPIGTPHHYHRSEAGANLNDMYRPTPHGPEGIAQLGHRNYVGGLWEEIGQLQFDFLISRGMKPASYLLDIACGSLRLGVKAIPYLEPRHYMGIDKEPELVRAGLEVELSPAIRLEKQPQLLVSSHFEFEKFESRPDFAIAQSLFTHLPPPYIELCFSKLFPALKEEGVFFATYFETEQTRANPEQPHDHGLFAYTRDEMAFFGTRAGFRANYIGAWNHPRNQVIVEYRK